MKKALTRSLNEIYYYKNGVKKIIDRNNKLTYPSNISGNITNLYGNVTNIRGNIDECGLTDKERENEVDIQDLVQG